MLDLNFFAYNFMYKLKGLFFTIFLFSLGTVGESALIYYEGRLCESKLLPTLSVSEHYDKGYEQISEKKWEEALNNFLIVLTHFPDSPFAVDSSYFAAICYYFIGDYDTADAQFNRYLKADKSTKYFDHVFEFKYLIAKRFSEGSRKHLFGMQKLPCLAPAKEEALTIFDEVIAAMPNQEVAVKALFEKAKLHIQMKEDKEGIEVFQTLIRRFPAHSLAAESYLRIADVYVEKNRLEPQNPDFCALAQMNLRKFAQQFPGDERVAAVEEHLTQMKERCAESLYQTGKYYERKKKCHASLIYYNEAQRRYPETDVSAKCQKRIEDLAYNVK